MRLAAVLLAAAALAAAAGCARDLEALPAFPREAPPPAERHGPVAEIETSAPPEGPSPGGALDPSRDGDRVLAGVVLIDPRLDGPAAEASSAIRNDSGLDLPDLILAVIFAVPGPDAGSSLVPRFETVEAPLARGQTRVLRAKLGARDGGGDPVGFRVVAGLPEVLVAGGGDLPGATFLGGLLECVELDADLTAKAPTVAVGLAERGAAAEGARLPPLEVQLLAARAGSLAWSGPWVLLPRKDPDGGGVRRLRWTLPESPGLPGCHLYLRVREKR
jgi:hypothetical protein